MLKKETRTDFLKKLLLWAKYKIVLSWPYSIYILFLFHYYFLTQLFQ